MVNVTLEQKLVLLYLAFGLVAGFISHYSFSWGFLLSYILPLAFFAAVTAPLMRFMKGKDKGKHLFSVVMTYLLVWFTVWIFLFNMYPI